ncbi:aldehyde dehydrogenase [Erwinia sp. OLTSP20]|uniref:acetaldehyde dehydrogenase ExaC n=1 Tax=unclassified Erwinia TaxID=2622719 RepID=UPI000C17BE2A|nr:MULTISPECIES: aldehyde dehydrogenase family protein [unclassified Erwinia]PIJ52237.1 aldehyde dehydrogenase [Erwinia sp. OAMSP11]PIJ75720.1 aldehyde dehydrogenase [Erwinia sp. OLSSP12]PIJ83681.1 aldehyde dehydrogenase [Erwinia sp. OLMTSP26]PIJ84244.1 aldehyde dehydrogenase [Erwinia sp. OLCASP19]PIJ88709.1 aldehyde dehydrogenase [Erwinia sp. OLMDSP33]
MRYAHPGSQGCLVSFRASYGNYINGAFVEPLGGNYFTDTTPVTGAVVAQFPRSDERDINKALDAAHAAAEKWGKTSVQERSNLLLAIADRMQANLEILAVTESWDNGKPIRETLNADLPLAIDHFRYFAGCLRAQEGSAAEIDATTVAYHIYEPLGVVGQIIPWNFPLLMAAWKLAPALAAGNCVVLKPAEQTPLSICVLLEIIGDLIPAGVLNVVQGFGKEAGEALATSKRIAKIAFTGSTAVGRHIMACAAESIIPSTVELGGKSPNVYFADIMQAEPEFIDKAVEGLVLGFFNQGEVCTCPSRALIQESIYQPFMEKVMARVATIRRGDPLDTATMIGAQASQQQFDKIMSYIDIARNEGGQILAGGESVTLADALANGYYIQPTLIKGHNQMRCFQEEVFGPVIGVLTFKDEAEALELANQTDYGLGAGVWTRDSNLAWRMGRAIKAGRVWTNCYHIYPAHAAFGGYKQSGVGRETHKMALTQYQQVKNLLVSYDISPLGLF